MRWALLPWYWSSTYGVITSITRTPIHIAFLQLWMELENDLGPSIHWRKNLIYLQMRLHFDFCHFTPHAIFSSMWFVCFSKRSETCKICFNKWIYMCRCRRSNWEKYICITWYPFLLKSFYVKKWFGYEWVNLTIFKLCIAQLHWSAFTKMADRSIEIQQRWM